MSDFFHGIRVIDRATVAPSVATASSSVIAVLGTVDEGPKDWTPEKPYLVTSATVARSFKGGTIADALAAIFAQAEAKVVVCGVKNSDELEGTALELLNIKQGFDLDLGFIIAPGADLHLLSELKAIAERVKAVLIVDLPAKDQGPDLSMIDTLRSERVIACFPQMLVPGANGTTRACPLSPFIAGVFARIDSERGFWHSPSNQLISEIVGLATPVPYIDDDPECLANKLNAQKVLTVIRDGGFRLWGNSGLWDENNPAGRFISVVRTRDVINRSLRQSLRWAIDRGITRNLITEITAKANEFLAQLRFKGAIIDGKATPDEAQNTPSAFLDGKLFFTVEFTPVFIAEAITFTSVLTDKYLTNLAEEKR